jgi:hypothetical protein
MKANEPRRTRVRCMLSLIVDGTTGPAARHGLQELRRALQAASASFEECGTPDAARGDTLLVAGLPSSPAVAEILRAAGSAPPQGTESILIQRVHWQGRKALLVSGGDDRGLMYALLDVADRIGWAEGAADPLSRVRDARESPYVAERSLSIYTMHKAHFLRRFHDEAYWARYLDMLARNRFNTLALLFAYESAGLFAPPYPYFFEVPGFPDVRVDGLTREEQARSLRSLNRLIAMTHERGLDFTLGIWDHVYRGGVQQGPGQDAANPLPWRVLGLSEDNLVDYSVAALACLLQRVPNLNAIQFRMHGESGLTREEMDVFWARIYDVMAPCGSGRTGIRFDARAKGFPDHLIDLALEKGVDIRICTKYWMEQMGLPYHPTHVHPRNQMDRRHGYADLLRYPRRYQVLWRLWNGGTSRVLLWGDPEYVRRFAASTHLYDGAGFDVNEPLATKMASQDHDLQPFDLLKPAYRSYDWEYERYWHFYQLWGRLSYNPRTPSEVWEIEFARRFGAAASAVERALHLASRVLPRIVAYNYPYRLFPTTRGWVEKQRMGDLAEYAAALPSDTQQFLSFDEVARNQVEGEDSPKVHPLATSAWFARISHEVLSLMQEAEQRIGDARNAEFAATVVDLRILAYLALYHARRSHAGLSYALFQRTQDLHALDDAIAHEGRAVEAWEQLVAAAGDTYADDLRMGLESAGLSGHWRDELAALREGLEALREQRTAFRLPQPEANPWIAHVPARQAAPGRDLIVRATVSGHTPLDRVRVGYGRERSEVCWLDMTGSEPSLYYAVIPGAEVVEGLRYWIEALDDAGRQSAFPEGGPGDPLSVTVADDNEPPTVIHEPIRAAPAGKPLTVMAQVRDPSGVRWARLRYRSVTQFQDYRSLDMLPTGRPDEYQATVPGEHVDPQWDFMYLIEAMDNCGNGTIYPNLEVETPYVVARLEVRL